VTASAVLPEHETSPVVVRDVFPAEVHVDGLVYRSARAIVTRERVYVFQAEGRERILRLDEAYAPVVSVVPRYNAAPREHATLALVADPERVLVIRRQRGCGCGSPLRGWRPWNPFLTASV
jgi:hypothetical protein